MSDPRDPTEPPTRVASSELVEIYKVAVASAERVSDRRQIANNFYLSIVTALITAYFGSFASHAIPSLARTIICAMGAFVSIGWLAAILGFRTHNAIKFEVIAALEKRLSFAFFAEEEAAFQRRALRTRFTTLEVVYPAALAAFFVALLVWGN